MPASGGDAAAETLFESPGMMSWVQTVMSATSSYIEGKTIVIQARIKFLQRQQLQMTNGPTANAIRPLHNTQDTRADSKAANYEA